MTDKETADEYLMIFTRYPEPGKAKTRLIPALGAEGAAALHRQMAEQTLTEARKLRASRSVGVEVQFAGGDRLQMQHWLGADLHYQPQSVGDLGERLAQAFRSAFDRCAKSIVTIGTDCPDVDANLLATAFDKLQTYDLVLGPATDGGYYLIGLSQWLSDIFVGISWSTSVVLQQTVTIAERLELSIAYLPMLSDVDRPEDLKASKG